ncbi:hypothetical protein KI387_026023 [Taxus chinensis]|uniref:Bifunctional inhibitor/plant lipid transfer protein/seed storage helical domain-containing protein n=1 Tax=Taxus chinensis TaxID=29808 RepID=A0AA38FVM4_TAXCH|nr:hypothetical protein KI387_026023 [Taxus chinensis]
MTMRKAAALLVMLMISICTTIHPVVAHSKPYYSPPSHSKCPLNALKLGACVDVLGGLVHVGLGDPVVNQCCPLLEGLLEVEAALCLCTTIRIKLLNVNIILPLALDLLVKCGMTPPDGFKCPPLQ